MRKAKSFRKERDATQLHQTCCSFSKLKFKQVRYYTKFIRVNDATHFLQNCSSFILVIHGVSSQYTKVQLKSYFADCMCAKILLLFSQFFLKNFCFSSFCSHEYFPQKKRKIYTIVVICTGVSFLLSAQLLSNIKVLKKRTGYGVNPTLGKLRAGSKECVACAFCYCFLLLHCYSFFTLCASSSVELLSKNSRKHEVHLTLIKTFFPSFVSTSFKNKKEN